MIRRTQDLSAAARAGFDAIIDVRSPSEYAVDHLPGAINLPVLDDAERAEIGTLYVQTSRFLARRLGAAKISRNIAAHLEGPMAGWGKEIRALVYCWRGGQRSGAMALVMDQVGWDVTLVDGGYKRWRRQVVASLHAGEEGLAMPGFLLLEGPTGTGKTVLLDRLRAIGVQTLDLEALARHRGSLFGAMPGGQPSQKQFETRIYEALERLDPARPVIAEAESSRIGDLSIPARLWEALEAAGRIAVIAPMAARVKHILAHYADIAGDRTALDVAIDRLPSHHSRETVDRWRALAAAGDIGTLARELMEAHYDPAYARWSSRRRRPLAGQVESDLTEIGLMAAAQRIAALAEQV